MFALTGDDLAGAVLGCGDGPASFDAEATALGHRVTRTIISPRPRSSASASAIPGKVKSPGRPHSRPPGRSATNAATACSPASQPVRFPVRNAAIPSA
jgi:hypothetical protein